MTNLAANVTGDDLKMMLRIAAGVVVHHGAAYLPVLERLKREYDAYRRNDPAEFARQLLAELGP